MLYPSDFEKKIGFDQIRDLLEGSCLSDLGREEVEKMRFSADHQEVTTRLTRTEEFRQVLLSGIPFPLQSFEDPTALLVRLRIENTFPEPEQLAEFRNTLVIYLDIVGFFTKERSETYPELAKLVDENQKSDLLTPHLSFSDHPASGIRDLIDRILDEKAQIRDSASDELGKIRREINRLHGGIQKKMNHLFGEARKNGWTEEDADLTVRDGRLVIPFRSAYKRKIPGVVHDESATGQTVFVEPVEMFEMNNEIRELRYAERREIIRILIQVADQIRPFIPELLEVLRVLGAFDFIRAKAKLALQTGGALCNQVFDKPHIRWFRAVHPLLYLSHKKAGKVVVPQDIQMPADKRVLVISGPNAGGKSICMKSVGLLQYMTQCGLLPTAREDSEFGLFHRIMIDIGDEQSLENDLSTYTSKLLNMKFFLENLDEHSLFLIDEMGSGTDPSIGGAIAEVALLSMAATGAFGVVTTHYSNLKLLAELSKITTKDTKENTKDTKDSFEPFVQSFESFVVEQGDKTGIVNGAMLFDTKTMKPMYRLQIGKPGSSFAVEIARTIGFPEPELNRASDLIGGSQLDFEKQLQELEQEKEEVGKKRTEVQVADEFLGDLIQKYEKLVSDLEKSRKEILEKAREEACQLLQDSNKLIERTIKEIRESQAERKRTKEARNTLEAEKKMLTNETTKDTKDNTKGTKDSFESFVPPFEPFVVKTIEKQTTKNEKRSAKSEQRTTNNEQRAVKSNYSEIISHKQAAFSLTLDLRGKRVEEAFTDLQRFIDDASLLSVKEVRILHGKGTGALREVTRNYMKGRNEVQGFRDEEIERGGGGITVVTLY